MSERLSRAFPTDLEVRSDGRTIVGIAAPFDSPTQIRDASGAFTEIIRRGAFSRTIRERGDRVKLLVNHQMRTLPIGRASLLREDASGLYGEFRVSATSAGEEALTLVRDGALDGFSIGFETMPQGEKWDRAAGTRELTELRLWEVSVVGFPAYDRALVAGVRSMCFDPARDPEFLQRQLDLLAFGPRRPSK